MDKARHSHKDTKKSCQDKDATEGRVIRIKSKNEAILDNCEVWKPKAQQVGSSRHGAGSLNEMEPVEHQIYIPPRLKTGDEVIAARKALKHRAGFNLDELNLAHVKVTGENKPQPCKGFEGCGLSDQILSNLHKCEFKYPTPVQKYVMPMIGERRDVMACGQTGSGKTAAFILPIVNTLSKMRSSPKDPTSSARPKALIISPVRELALQIANESQMYLTGTGVTATAVYGGTSTSEELRRLKVSVTGKIADAYTIIVATPGRLQQLLNDGRMVLEDVEFVVVDEADKMLEGGFLRAIYDIYEFLPPTTKRVTSIFSATYPLSVQKLAQRFLANSYLFVVVGTVGGASYDVDQTFKILEAYDKYGTLTKILSNASEKDKILVFCETRSRTQDLVDRLTDEGVPVVGIHGEMFQSEREESLNQFTRAEKQVLVASGVAARGLDIPHVSIVVNYDMPESTDEYVQQIGRTGRIGNKGKAISFFEINRDGSLVNDLTRKLTDAGQPVPEIFEQLSETERGRLDPTDQCMMYQTADIRHFNALGIRQKGVPLPCEARNDAW